MSAKKKPTNRRSTKQKVTRTLLCNLWGNKKSPFEFRNYGPGQHGTKAKLRTAYGTQLRAKQMLRNYYHMTEKQFRKVFNIAHNKKGDTGENLIAMLETRLDATLFNANFVPSIFAARQLVNHRHVKVNGKIVDIRSYNLCIGDVVTLTDRAKEFDLTKAAMLKQDRRTPDYLNTNNDSVPQTSLNRIPSFSEVPYPFNMEINLVIELYSK